MGAIVAKFLGIFGPDVTIPTNIYELIPYLFTIFVSACVFVGLCWIVVSIAKALIMGGRFRP